MSVVLSELGYGRAMAIDPAYGSSSFGIVITQLVDSQVRVLYADEYQRPHFNDMLNVTMGLVNKYQVQKIYIDAANPSFIRSLKLAIGDRDVEHKEMLGHAKMILEKGSIAITLHLTSW